MGPPLDRRAALRRFAAPALVASALLLACYLRTSEGTQHPSPWGYRTWSFATLTYSDILALHEDRGAARHPMPYLHDKIEYPVLLGLAMWFPSVIEPNRGGYFALTFLLLALSALATLWVLAQLPETQPWSFAASPALLVYSALNWDLIGLLPLALGLWLWAKSREKTAAAVLALAVWTKFFPLLFFGVFLLVCLRKSLRHVFQLLGIFLLVSLAVNLPFALASLENWGWFFKYNQIRDIEPSLYLLAGRDPKQFAPTANLISASVVLATAAGLALAEFRTRRLDPLRAACGLVCMFFAVNKVYSPQYWLWVTALIALAALPGWLSAAASAIALADFVVSFGFLHLQFDRQEVGWFAHQIFWPMVTLRYAALFACAAWALSHSLRTQEVR